MYVDLFHTRQKNISCLSPPFEMVGIKGLVSTAQKEVAMPTSFIENKVWVGVLSLTGSKTSFWAMDSSHFREDTAARKLDRGLDI